MLLRKLAGLVAAAALVGVPATASSGPVCVPGGPYAATQGQALDHLQAVSGWSNQTLRFEATTSIGGSQLRVHLSNEWSASAVTFAHVSVALQLNQAQAAGAPTAVTFNGAPSVTVAAGAETVSDAMAFPTTPGERLLVSIYLPSGQNVTSAPVHTYSGATEYNIIGSDATMATAPGVSNTFTFTAFLGGIDVDATSAQTVVAVGDSITDLGGSGVDTDDRWPDYLARRAALAVVNAGISGNWVTADQGSNGGPSLQHRLQHDVIGETGVRTAVVADGINDLRGGVPASALESAQAGIVASIHAAGLRAVLATITPCAGEAKCTTAVQGQIDSYNQWVRSGASGADAVADFNAAVANGSALAGMYDSGDHLHPNAAGMEMLAETIDTSKL